MAVFCGELYSHGIASSREIERACQEHITFIALSGDSSPHFTTITAFVSGLDDEIARLFSHVLYTTSRSWRITAMGSRKQGPESPPKSMTLVTASHPI